MYRHEKTRTEAGSMDHFKNGQYVPPDQSDHEAWLAFKFGGGFLLGIFVPIACVVGVIVLLFR
jgi:hypothetical protein